ncbi:MAG: monovalent cation/H(+) antiporter subunit G [Phascolarctobacterium faecium]
MIADITLREFLAGLFLAGGAFFLLASAIGMLRLPDFYCRLHASGNSETLGVMLSFMGLVIYEGLTLTSLKMIMIFLLIFLGNPIGTHILSKAAYKSGHHVWTLEEDAKEEKNHADLPH